MSRHPLKSRPTIGLIIGSTREGRFADHPAAWIERLAAARGDLDVERIDLGDFDLPFYGTGPASEGRASSHAPVKAWQAVLDRMDGYIITAAEYNHAPTAVLKNALDFAYSEWSRKPVAFVGYGGVGGARAVEQLREIAVELQMAPIKPAVHILMPDYLAVVKDGRSLDEMPHLVDSANAMLDDLAWWTGALASARARVLEDA